MTKPGKSKNLFSMKMAEIATVESINNITADLAGLARNCPALKNFDWITYLQASEQRIDNALDFLDRHANVIPSREVLDFGSWLGNFSAAAHYAGWKVTSSEMWARYSPALDRYKHMLCNRHIDCIDMNMILGRPQGPKYGAILFMAVIEHLSDSPRKILKILYDALLPGGLLILDTPNLAYLDTRRKLNRGLSPFPAIADQFYTEIPFEGHIREYTVNELKWMLVETGFTPIETKLFNYSAAPWSRIPLLDHLRLAFPPYYQSPILDSIQMALRPELREVVFMVGRKY